MVQHYLKSIIDKSLGIWPFSAVSLPQNKTCLYHLETEQELTFRIKNLCKEKKSKVWNVAKKLIVY